MTSEVVNALIPPIMKHLYTLKSEAMALLHHSLDHNHNPGKRKQSGKSIHILLLVLALIIISGTGVRAQTSYHWIGAPTGGDWNTSTNWGPNGVPVDGDNIEIISDLSGPITGHPAIVLNNLEIYGNCTFQSAGTSGTSLAIIVTNSFGIHDGNTLSLGESSSNDHGTNLILTSASTGTIDGTLFLNAPENRYITVSGSLGFTATSLISGGPYANFTLNPGATLMIANSLGISQSGPTGAVQVPGSRTFSAGANYIYNGTLPQVTGDGIYQNPPVNNLTIGPNPAGSNVTLSGNTEVSGTLTINNHCSLSLGNYTLGASNAPTRVMLYIGEAPGSIITGTGTLFLNGNIDVYRNSEGSYVASILCNLSLGGTTRTITVPENGTADADLTISGIISSGTGISVGIIKVGAGTLDLTGLNTFDGAVSIDEGVLRVLTLGNVNASSALGTGAGSSLINIGASGILRYAGAGHSTNRPVALTGWGATIDASGTGPMALSGGITGNTYGLVLTGTGAGSESGVIATSSGRITKTGGGTWTLSGTNTFTGGTFLTDGQLNINSSQALGASGTFEIDGGTVIDNTSGTPLTTVDYTQNWDGDFVFIGSNDLNLGTGSVNFNNDCQITVVAGNLTAGGYLETSSRSLTKAGAGTLSFGTLVVTLYNITINGGTLISTSDLLTVNGNFINNGTFLHNGGNVRFWASAKVIGGTSITTFNNIFIGSNTTLENNAIINGNLAISSGVLNLGTYTCNHSALPGNLAMGAGATLRIGGTNSLPSGYTLHNINPISFIEYHGTDQTVVPIVGGENEYGNLILSGSGTKLFSSGIAVENSLSIPGTAIVSLADGSTSSVGSLTLGGIGTPNGSWGSTSSSATHRTDQYFLSPRTGIVNILNSSLISGTWLGGASGNTSDWNTAENWYGSLIPTSSTDAMIPAYTSYQPMISTIAYADCNNLTVAPGASLSIQSTGVNSNGSLIIHGTCTGNVTYVRYLPNDAVWHYVSSPVNMASPSGSFWQWNEVSGVWEEVNTTSSPLLSGKGYTLIGGQGTGGSSTVSFTGSPVTSALQAGTAPYFSELQHYNNQRGTWGGGGWNLLGNPFTSAMSATTFITTNSGSLDANYQALYIYNGIDYYYIATVTPGYEGLGIFPSYTDIQVGQGFYVLANYDGVPFNYTSGMRSHNSATPMTKSAHIAENPWSGLLLKASCADIESSTLIVYNEKMTAGLDPGYDVGQLSNGSDLEIFTAITGETNDVKYARQALPVTDPEKNIIPVGISLAKGGTVSFAAFTRALDNYYYWLEDRELETFTKLNTDSYSVTLPANTYGTGRFFVHVSVAVPAARPETQDENGLQVWSSEGKVILKGDVSSMAVCEIYDVQGQKIVKTQLEDGEMNKVDLPSGSHGIFIVRVTDGLTTTIKKVVIL